VKKYGIGLILPGQFSLRRYEKAGYLFSGRTLSELAGRIGVDSHGLERSVARNNRFAATGVDEDFGKGSTPYTPTRATPLTRRTPVSGRSSRDLSTQSGLCRATSARAAGS